MKQTFIYFLSKVWISEVYLEPTETSLRPKKVVLFPEIGRMKFFYRSPVRIVECTSEYTFLVSKNNEQTSKKKKQDSN